MYGPRVGFNIGRTPKSGDASVVRDGVSIYPWQGNHSASDATNIERFYINLLTNSFDSDGQPFSAPYLTIYPDDACHGMYAYCTLGIIIIY